MNEDTTIFSLIIRTGNETQVNLEDPAVINANGPTMPELNIQVELEDPRFQVVSVRYEVTVSYQEHGRNDRAGVFSGHGPNNLQINFGNEIQGGRFAGRANVEIRRPNNTRYWSGWMALDEFLIIGSNPGEADVISECGRIPAAVIAKKLSGMNMFGSDGMPNFNGGFGLFLLSSVSPAQIWNWKANTAEGVNLFIAHEQTTSEYPQSLRDADPGRYKKLPDYNAEQLKMETYQSFSTGRYWYPKKAGIIFKKWIWKKDPKRNDFADDCLDIETDIGT